MAPPPLEEDPIHDAAEALSGRRVLDLEVSLTDAGRELMERLQERECSVRPRRDPTTRH